ncbi:Nucleic acid-binding, OB-fold [Artemisia annua]|uniref:Nucleic acid-binding, OB-fold n=1 Tax=Artemisia annua TaxID=35608 RepID=A0A2U1PFV6_ARTAN|nr:Nucleic acid-binding, OB-fold [Artemisia annua]
MYEWPDHFCKRHSSGQSDVTLWFQGVKEDFLRNAEYSRSLRKDEEQGVLWRPLLPEATYLRLKEFRTVSTLSLEKVGEVTMVADLAHACKLKVQLIIEIGYVKVATDKELICAISCLKKLNKNPVYKKLNKNPVFQAVKEDFLRNAELMPISLDESKQAFLTLPKPYQSQRHKTHRCTIHADSIDRNDIIFSFQITNVMEWVQYAPCQFFFTRVSNVKKDATRIALEESVKFLLHPFAGLIDFYSLKGSSSLTNILIYTCVGNSIAPYSKRMSRFYGYRLLQCPRICLLLPFDEKLFHSDVHTWFLARRSFLVVLLDVCVGSMSQAFHGTNSTSCCVWNSLWFGCLWYILSAKFSDVSGADWFSIFSDDAEKIIGCSADELEKMKSQHTKASWVPKLP